MRRGIWRRGVGMGVLEKGGAATRAFTGQVG